MNKPIVTITHEKTPAKYLPEAEALVFKADQTLKGISEKLSQGNELDPSWNIYREEEIQKRGKQKKEQARAQLVSELDLLEREIERRTKDLSEKMQRALRPLQSSPLTSEQNRGEYFEERAERRARRMTFEQLKEEHAQAIRNGQVDYASELVDYGELMFEDGEAAKARGLRLKHLEALGVGLYPDSISLLVKTLQGVRARRMLLTEGKDLSEAGNISELDMLALRFQGLKHG